MAGCIFKIPKELVKLHEEIFMTANILFVNGIPFIISLSRNITFTASIHLEDIKSIKIFKVFKEIYTYDLKNGFQITTLHVDGEFATLQRLKQNIPGEPRVNLGSASKHVPEIKRKPSDKGKDQVYKTHFIFQQGTIIVSDIPPFTGKWFSILIA